MSMRARIVATLDALDLECDGDRDTMQAMVKAEIAQNPQGKFASALRTLGIEPTIATLEEARDQIVPPFRPHVVGDATAASARPAEVAEREAIAKAVSSMLPALPEGH
jgi:hypothetical protein